MFILIAVTITFLVCMRTLPKQYEPRSRAAASLCISAIALAIIILCQRTAACAQPDPFSINYEYRKYASIAVTARYDLNRIISAELLVSAGIFIGWISCRYALKRALHCESIEVDRLLPRIAAYVSMTWFAIYIMHFLSGT